MPLIKLAGNPPKYQDYAKDKQKAGEKPLDKDVWERKVLHKKGPVSPSGQTKVKIPWELEDVLHEWGGTGGPLDDLVSNRAITSDSLDRAVKHIKKTLADPDTSKGEIRALNKAMQLLKPVLDKHEKK